MVKAKVLPTLALVRVVWWLALGVGTMLLVLGPVASSASPVDEASAVIGRFAAAWDANDVEGLVKLFTVDATYLGSRSPISQGTEAIRALFNSVRQPGDGAKITFGERRMVVLGDRAVFVTGFYEITRPGSPTFPGRLTTVIVKRGSDWLIVHSHTSVRPQ